MKKKGSKRFWWALPILLIFLLLCVVSCRFCGNEEPEPTKATGTVTVPQTMDTTPTTPGTTAPRETEPVQTVPTATEPTSPKNTQPDAAQTTEPGHTHKHTATVTKPTCTEKGYTEHTCSCGDSYKDTYVNATGHSWSEWKTTKEPTTSAAGQKTRTCSKCNSTETQSIDKLPADEKIDPATCKHNWKSNYYPEVGHYGDPYIACKCGARFSTTAEWISHRQSFPIDEQVSNHGSNATGQDYILESPGRWEWTCTKCGAVSSTKPY